MIELLLAFLAGFLVAKISSKRARLSGADDEMQLSFQNESAQMTALRQQRNELNAVLSSMSEGVIALDMNEQIIKLNRAAAEMLDVAEEEVKGKTIQELIRNRDFERYVKRGISGEDGFEGEVILHSRGDLYLQVYVSVLRDAGGKQLGVLMIVNNMTSLRKLERVRKDFVSNVSHELKTPITSIQGFVETLQDGALEQPQDARRFLGIIAKHTERLTLLIEDLLSLSRIEQSAEHGGIELERRSVRQVIESAVQLCQRKAEKHQVKVETTLETSSLVELNFTLLSQAVVNLIDNAIKFSPRGTPVQVLLGESEGRVRISVADQGPGIPEQHIPRLFERFYRVDEARSREMGGSGLGLALVKHIAQVHGGHVSVVSEYGKGSKFSIFLPIAATEAEEAA